MVVSALVGARGDALKRYAYLLCGDADSAEDLVQEALVRVLARTRRVPDDPRELENYVRRAMVNLVIDAARRATRWRSLVPRLSARDRVADDSGAVCERLALGAALARLPARQRACVVLHYYEDLPLTDIAEALGCGVGTVKSHLHDARRALALLWEAAAPEQVDTGKDMR